MNHASCRNSRGESQWFGKSKEVRDLQQEHPAPAEMDPEDQRTQGAGGGLPRAGGDVLERTT